MEDAVTKYNPEVIVCPFLTKRVPESIISNTKRPCLIVHPGIAGDRGPSSLDWALRDKKDQWGVTVLQATDVMDAGDIWCTENFPVGQNDTKTSLYVGDVSDSALNCVIESLNKFVQNVAPFPLSYDHPEVLGSERRPIKKKDRKLEWEMSSSQCSAIVRMSDTQPGAIAKLPIGDGKSTDFR